MKHYNLVFHTSNKNLVFWEHLLVPNVGKMWIKSTQKTIPVNIDLFIVRKGLAEFMMECCTLGAVIITWMWKLNMCPSLNHYRGINKPFLLKQFFMKPSVAITQIWSFYQREIHEKWDSRQISVPGPQTKKKDTFFSSTFNVWESKVSLLFWFVT